MEGTRLVAYNEIVTLSSRRAERRLQRLKKRFARRPEFVAQYKAVLNDYIANGYAVKLSADEAGRTSNITLYLPRYGVISPNKDNVRVVYDAAAEFGGTSLNIELIQGPQLNNSLFGVLIRFRKEEAAVASDIESMFHTEKDTDVLRFLWWDKSIDKPPCDHKMTVYLRCIWEGRFSIHCKLGFETNSCRQRIRIWQGSVRYRFQEFLCRRWIVFCFCP